MADWWVTTFWEISPVFLVSWVVWGILSVTLHELAHGWTAIRCGDDTPRHTGHMTLNPVVHMGQFGLIMFAVIGLPAGMMPVDPSRFRGRYDDAKVALAGPATNVLLAAVALALYVAVRGIGGGAWFAGVRWSEPLYSNLCLFCALGMMINLALAPFNLVPVPPLDGSRILSDFVPAYRRFWEQERAQPIALLAFMALFFLGGEYFWSFSISTTRTLTQWAAATLAAGSPRPTLL
jgi:Zn-dependent protease